jgi:hypothetical protein
VADMPRRDPPRAWWIAFAVCAVAAALPLLTTYRLPMADLPQHAVQLTVWKYYSDICYGFADTYFINWATPYLGGVFVMHVVVAILSVSAGLKLIVYLTILALPLAFKRIADFRGLDPFLALLAFPLSFGYSFYWGFINFNFATPIVLLLLLYVCRAAERGEGESPQIAFLAIVVALCHGLAYAFALVICGPLLFLRVIRKPTLWRPLAALLAPVPVLAVWAVHSASQQSRARAPWNWELGPARLRQLFDFLLSADKNNFAFSFALVLAGIVLLAGATVSREHWRWLPVLSAAAGFFFIPTAAFGQTLLYQRMAIFVAASALLALSPRTPVIPRMAARSIIAAAAVLWMLVLAGQFALFNREAQGFDQLVDIMPVHQRVLLLNMMQSDVVTGYPYLHFSGYYLARKGGVIGWSFASNFPAVIRYRPGFDPGVESYITFDPRFFDWKKHSHFDFFIVRAPADLKTLLFSEAGDALRLRASAGNWWLYEHVPRPAAPSCQRLERDADHQPVLNLALVESQER